MRYAITWLALAITIVVVVGRLNWPGYRRLAAVGVPGQATVVELLPNIHNTVRYEYRGDGRLFQGQMQSWRPTPPLSQLAAGHASVIYYDPQHPENSVLGYPKMSTSDCIYLPKIPHGFTAYPGARLACGP